MNREEINDLLDYKLQKYRGVIQDQHIIEIRHFIFKQVIPEVLKSVLPDETFERSEYWNWYDVCIDNSKQKAKELYNIEL